MKNKIISVQNFPHSSLLKFAKMLMYDPIHSAFCKLERLDCGTILNAYNIRLLTIFFLPIFLISCGPIYDTQYSYLPPESSEGRACIFQCENSRSQCQELEHYRNQDCERRSTYDYERCRDDIRYRYGREPKWHECNESSCSSIDEERCDSQFRYCYQSCGGRVEAQTVCVANCQGANPPVRQGVGSSYPTGGYQKYPRPSSSGNSIYPKY